MRLGDLDKLKEELKYHFHPTDQEYETDRRWAVGYNAGLNRALYSIAYAKTVDVVPVKQGRWIPTGMSNSTGPIVRCSVCGQYINPSAEAIELNRQKLEPSFCEKCGAKMNVG